MEPEKLILTAVGDDDYEIVSYQWGERQAVQHKLIQHALAEWFPGSKMFVLATNEAEEKYGKAISNDLKAEIVHIPRGSNEGEYWKIFNTIKEKIPPGVDLVLDITHGFRSLPVLVLLAVSFLRAAKQVRVKHVLYGVHQKGERIAPVIDLVTFISMLDWASATNRFLETGDVRRLAQIPGAFSKNLEDSIRHLQVFSTALQLHYPLQAGQAAQEGLESLGQVREKLPEPMKILENRLIDSIRPMAFTDQDPQERQLLALFNQILWYRQHGHYEKAVGLASEWVHLFAKWKTGHGIWSENFSLKKELEKRNESWAGELRGLHEEIKSLRDNISHWQFKRKSELQRSELEDTPQQVEDLIGRLKNLVHSAGLELPEET